MKKNNRCQQEKDGLFDNATAQQPEFDETQCLNICGLESDV
jgi:hypothetical protein